MKPVLRFLSCGFLFAGALSAAEPAPAAPARWRYETMRPPQLAEAIRTRPVAWLVISPLEWHGEAIAFNADPLVGQTVAERAWEKAGGVLLPTLYIGAETEYKMWEPKGLATYWGLEVISKEHNPGSIYVRPLTVELVLREYLEALQREGFKYVVVVSGHGGYEHVETMRAVCAQNWGGMKVMMTGAGGGGRELPEQLRFKPVPGASHANISEASRVGGIDPTLVDKSAFGLIERDRETGLLAENVGDIDFAKGKAVIDLSIEILAARVATLVGELPAEEGRSRPPRWDVLQMKTTHRHLP
jgi:creatinine amidohydrolase/Fe(II)-dependent formamide hydrolase-like protein